MDILKKTIPEPDAMCRYCPRPIWIKNEPNKVLYVASGKPICAVCRVLRGKSKGTSAIIKKRKELVDTIQKEADEKAKEVAIESQKND